MQKVKKLVFSLSLFIFSSVLSLPTFANDLGLPAGDWLPNQFTLFESGQVRPLALSDNGEFLYSVNTPDNRLEIFRVLSSQSNPLEYVTSVQVGLEPVAVAVHGQDVWVVNHLSDSVSIVDVSTPEQSRVVRTLSVGDEPRDIVFAGTGKNRAFITTAHRGQNNPIDPQLTTPGVGRADVWVFDHQQDAPLTIVTLFADTPRALAVSADGNTVYAASFMSGNKTSIIHDTLVTNGGETAVDGFGLPAPNTNVEGVTQPEASLIVQHNGTDWIGPAGRVWNDKVRFNLPDLDVFAIDAVATPPVRIIGPTSTFAGVGTVLFNMAVNPVNGKIYVSNTDANNLTRFEGPGVLGGSTVRGRTHENRITVLDGNQVKPRFLNKHIDFSTCCAPIPNAENDKSLAQPLEMAVTGDGKTLYVAAFGSSKIGVFDTAKLENDTFVPNAANHIEVTGGGPTGVVIDDQHNRLYVLTRFDNSISVIDSVARTETVHIALFNPEPVSVIDGRPLLYDARKTSSRGNGSCASCHIFGDMDQLAWDLGDPDGLVLQNNGPFIFPVPVSPAFDFHPIKGPMTTQSLRGMDNHGPMHWRGDRNGAVADVVSAQPDTGLFDEIAAFEAFNVAFPGLVGRSEQLTSQEMTAFAEFAVQIMYPPNPIRNLDNSQTAAQAAGEAHYFILGTDGNAGIGCNTCHVLDPSGNAEFGVARPGFFGSNGLGIFEGTDLEAPGSDFQSFKIPHIRNAYQKVGMFGLAQTPDVVPHTDPTHMGDQIRGFGFTHDGSFDTLFRFMLITSFSDAVAPNGFPFGPEGDGLRRDMEQFLLAYPSNLAPVVGQQVTLSAPISAEDDARLNLLMARAAVASPECELVATNRQGVGLEQRYLFLAGSSVFQPNQHSSPNLTTVQLRALADTSEVTLTCVPPGSGYRMALDADLDGCFDVTEQQGGFDPRDPASHPLASACI